MKPKFFASLFAFSLFAVTAFAQRPGSAAPPPNSPSNPGAAGNAGNAGVTSTTEQLNQLGFSGVPYSGRVTAPDGILPWDPIHIVVTCDGTPRYSTYTDSHGQFVITPTSSGASVGGELPGEANSASAFVGCEVHAVFPGYKSSSVVIANRSIVDNPDVGTIKLTPEVGSAYASLSATGSAVPKNARKAFEKARSEWLDKKPDPARKDLEKAV